MKKIAYYIKEILLRVALYYINLAGVIAQCSFTAPSPDNTTEDSFKPSYKN